MRSLAVVAVLLATLGVGLALAAAPAAGHGIVVTGQVTDADGDPVPGAAVLVQPTGAGILQNATDGDRAVGASVAKLAAAPPVGLRVNETTADGTFKVHLAYTGRYELLAVSGEGVSRLRTVTVRYLEGTRNLTIDPATVQRVAAGDAGAPAGGTATVEVRLENTDDVPVEDLTVSIGSLPPGWSVVDVETGGTAADDGTVSWARVPAGDAATATVALRVPPDATNGTRAIAVTADSATHFVEHGDDIRVRVGPGRATPTVARTPTEDGGLVTIAPTTPGGAGGTSPLLVGSVAVFVVGLGVSGYAVWRTGLPGRR